MPFWQYGFTKADLEITSHYIKKNPRTTILPSSLYQILHEMGTWKTYMPVVLMVVCITQGELCIHVIYGFELVEFRPILQSSWDIVIQYIWCCWSVVQYIMILWYSIEPYSAWDRTHNSHPITRSYGRAMGWLLWEFGRKWPHTKLARHRHQNRVLMGW